MTALEYMKSFDLIFPPTTEEEALEMLIESHRQQRDIVHDLMRRENERTIGIKGSILRYLDRLGFLRSSIRNKLFRK